MSRKFALIIGNSEYKDTSLARLKTREADLFICEPVEIGCTPRQLKSTS